MILKKVLEGAVEEFQDYSYSFNIKILGVPELSDREKAEDTSNLCVNSFNKMGAEVSIRDIDRAHRVSFGNTVITKGKHRFPFVHRS